MKYSKEEIVYRTCKTVVRHIRNHVEEDRGGIHTRLFSHILHPENDFVCLGKSSATNSSEDTHPEHVVPCVVLVEETRRLIREGQLTDDDIAKLLQKHWKIALITKNEARTIDYELGYKSTMPEGWCFETGDTLARLRAANINITLAGNAF
ncbi:MAG: hypothetical protein ACR65R_05490 [Methylomicrobium sp.]